MIFNINNDVRVKLTPKGLSILKARHDKIAAKLPRMGPFIPPKTDNDGWSTFQMWQLFDNFGEHVYMSAELPFGTEIDIPTPPPPA